MRQPAERNGGRRVADRPRAVRAKGGVRDKERDRHLTLRRPLGEECIAPRCEHRPHPMTHPSWRLRDDAESRLGSRGSIRDGLDRVSTDEQRESDFTLRLLLVRFPSYDRAEILRRLTNYQAGKRVSPSLIDRSSIGH